MWLSVILLNCLRRSWVNPALFSLCFLGSTSGWTQSSPEPELVHILHTHLADTDSFPDRYTAQAWLLDMSRRMRLFIEDPSRRIQLLKLVHREASRARLSPELVLALIQTESSFDRFAISRSGAQGLMQVMPFWKQIIGQPQDNLTDIATNLRYGSTILSHYLDKENGNLTRALARYNGSLGELWYPQRVYRNWLKHWKRD